jgi:predicted double-glycine peptidase
LNFAPRKSVKNSPRRHRILAATILAIAALTASCVASVSLHPLRPLRAVERASLQMRGARFESQGRARLQSSLNDCGPTALADFLELSGVQVPSAATLRRLTDIQPRGTTLGNLATAAERAGLRVFPVRWDPVDIANLPTPSLVWVEKSHFVVVARRARDDSVEINDPAAGRYMIAADRFARLWSGEALIPLDSISPRRRPEAQSELRPHRPRGTRANKARTSEV